MFLYAVKFFFNSVCRIFRFFYNFNVFLHTVLPFGLDVGILGVGAFYCTKLRKPESSSVLNVFGPEPGSKESTLNPEKLVKCIAHRGAGLDAPENSMEAFKYCVDRECNFVEVDVRTSKDGKLVLLHDEGLERLTGTQLTNVHEVDWDRIKDIDVGCNHPNRSQFREVRLCLLEEAVDFLLSNNVRMIIDMKGDDQEVVNGILKLFKDKPALYENAAVTCFNPWKLYQVRKSDPKIVGAISYRPYCFSAQDYDAENGPCNPRYGNNLAINSALRLLDMIHAAIWRWTVRWCSASAVFLHKDIVSPSEISYWRQLGIRCIGWSVNRPLEKLYWRGVLKAPYLANTLLGEPEVEKKAQDKETDIPLERAGPIVDQLLEPERQASSGQN